MPMHKSLPIAVIALFLIASPLTMFGTINSNLFSKAMAIEQDGSKTDIKSFIKTIPVKDTGTSDDEDKSKTLAATKTSDDDEDKSKSLAATKSSDDDEDKSKSLAATKSSDDDEDKSKSLAAT